MPSATRAPARATIRPPAAAPATMRVRAVDWMTPIASGNSLPGTMSRTIADLAESKAGWTAVTAYSSAMSASSGTPGTSMPATRTIRAASAATMTVRRGRRSARPDRNKAPAM
jgi:flagellar hook-length control protein FliK